MPQGQEALETPSVRRHPFTGGCGGTAVRLCGLLPVAGAREGGMWPTNAPEGGHCVRGEGV